MKITKAYRLNKHDKLFSFDDPMGEIPITNKPLSQWQEEAVQKAGLTLIDINDESEISDDYYLIFDNNLFFTADFVKKAGKISETSNGSIQFCLEHNTFNDRYVLPTNSDTDELRKFNFYFRLKGNTEINHIIVPQKVYANPYTLPRQLVKTGQFTYDMCDTFVSAMISPFHLWGANMAMLLNRALKFRKLMPDWAAHKYIKERTPFFSRMLRMQNKIGRGCRIHPTAVIECAVLGDNVIVGANSTVRFSNLGDDCIIEDNTFVLGSSLGNKTCISHGNVLLADVTFEEVYLIHGPYQFSVYGKNSAVFGTINCDFRLDQENIKILTEEGVLSSGQTFMGIAFGHRSKVAGGNIIAPGRIVPNDYHISSPDSMISKFPPEKNANNIKDKIDWF